jgi:hypothetical protein
MGYLVKREGHVSGIKDLLERLRIRKLSKRDWKWTIISTISVAVSSLVTCLVLIIGVILIVPLTPVLNSPVLQPAFDTVVPALFGALGYKYFSKTPVVAVAPFLAMTVLCLLVPSAANQVALLVPASAIISIIVARILYKKNKV